jgi:hypothetical protein
MFSTRLKPNEFAEIGLRQPIRLSASCVRLPQKSIEWQQGEEEANDKLNRAIDALCKTPVRTMRGLITKVRIGEIDRDVVWATLYRSSTACSRWRPSTRRSWRLGPRDGGAASAAFLRNKLPRLHGRGFFIWDTDAFLRRAVGFARREPCRARRTSRRLASRRRKYFRTNCPRRAVSGPLQTWHAISRSTVSGPA